MLTNRIGAILATLGIDDYNPLRRDRRVRLEALRTALDHPLLGDVLYSAPETDLIARPALHAHSLAFTHPQTNERLKFTAPYPPDFESALSSLSGNNEWFV